MRRRAFVAPIVVACAALAFADDPKNDEDPNDLASLEKLVLRVELEGRVDGKRLREDLSPKRIADLGELPRPKELRFPSVKSSIDAEAEFTKKYYEQYNTVYDDVGAKVRDLGRGLKLLDEKADDPLAFAKAFLKKFPAPKRLKKGDAAKLEKDRATNDVRAIEARLLERWDAVRAGKKLDGKPLEKELHAREEKARAFLKRYEYGKGIATTRLDGSANLHVDLAKDVYELVKKNLQILQAQPLKDEAGKPLEWRGKPVHGATKIFLLDLKNALEELSAHEYYVVQYSQRDGDEEKGLMRLTGARLLFGTYHVLEAPDRVVVYVPEPRE